MKKNIVLIGILGSGKSTLGKALARRLSMTFVDMDAVIEQEAQMKISQIFARCGEAHFREKETQLAQRLGKAEGLVISTGGGIILREENMKALKQNGVVVFLDRSPYAIIGKINCDNRPLLKEHPERLFSLHRERLPLYRRYADLTCKNRGTFGQTLSRLLRTVATAPQLSSASHAEHGGRRETRARTCDRSREALPAEACDKKCRRRRRKKRVAARSAGRA